MASKHKMICYAPFGLQPDSIQVEITYTYSPGSPAVYYGTPQPAEDASLDFVSAKATLHALDDTMQAMLTEWAQEYLADDSSAGGYHDACNAASDENIDAREDAADFRRRQARDDALTERSK
jgi:hypothetical protein